MQKKNLGNSDLIITSIGFGAWAIGGSGWQFGWGAQDDKESIKAIHKSLEFGINWIDTAAVYGLGHSEEVVAEALKEWNGERPYIFTKCGQVADEKGVTYKTLKAKSLRKEIEKSLKLLQTDVIDLYQIHWPINDNMSENEEGWKTLLNFKKEGKVRWIGVSNFNVEQMTRISQYGEITSLQPPYSLINRRIEKEILPYCRKNNIGVIVYSPMGSGLLTGAMSRDRIDNFPDDDWRKNGWDFTEPRLSRNLKVAEACRIIGEKYSAHPGEIAIAWTLMNPAVTGAIVGARSAKQVEGIIRAAELNLKQEDIDYLESF